MPRGGNNRLPTEVKKKKGTLEKSRESKNAVEYADLEKAPSPPDSLSEGPGRAKWIALAAHLVKIQVLKYPDLDALEAYCIAYANVQKAKEELEQNGSCTTLGAHGNLVNHPAVGYLDKSQTQLRHWGSLLGLNPASRGRMTTGGEGSNEPKPKGFGDLRPVRGSGGNNRNPSNVRSFPKK